MLVFLIVLKWVLVLGLLAVGVVALLGGAGVSVPLIKAKFFEAQSLPAGSFLVIAAIALAYFWRIRWAQEEETTNGGGKRGASAGAGTGKKTKKKKFRIDFIRRRR